MNIIVTGGAGYVGSKLVPHLLYKGHKVTVIDRLFFGNHLPEHKRLMVVQKDIREVTELNCDVVIHLASIPNDPAVELNVAESWDINVMGTFNLIERAIEGNVRKFIYASSGSVYGVSDRPRVTEDTDLVPISTYNKTKMIAEKVLLTYPSEMIDLVILRPATICGFSPRMRNDLTVNMLTFQALTNGEITVFGGDQIRPNISILDMVYLYTWFAENEYTGIFNTGFENLSVLEIANKISNMVPGCNIKVIEEVTDARSYRLDSSKLWDLGFELSYTIEDMIDDLIHKFINKEWIDDPRWNSVETLKEQLCLKK